ncbi:MAG: hypothetical protein WC728_03790 [Elusimicrobiota bacterium]
MIPERLLPDSITIKKPVQSMAPGTLQPVFRHETVAVGIKARFDPVSVALQRGVLGAIPKRMFRLFLNVTDLKENYLVVREADGRTFTAVEVLDMFGDHLEAALEEKS